MVYTTLLFALIPACVVLAQTDTLSLEILDLPDSAYAFSPVSFRVKYNTGKREMALNTGFVRHPVNYLGMTRTHVVRGEGEIVHHYRIPDHRRSTGFSVTAYLTRDGTWAGREFLVSSQDTMTKILPARMDAAWEYGVPDTIRADTPFVTTIRFALIDTSAKIIPYLIVDLVEASGRVVARQIEWSVREKGTFKHSWTLPATANASELRLRARLESDGYDLVLPPFSEVVSPPFTMTDSRAPVFGRVEFRNDSLYLDGKPSFLHGVNLSSFWYAWDEETIRREVRAMHDIGLNFIRVFLDWNRFEPRPGEFSQVYRNRITTLLRTTDSLGIWVEPVPIANWGGWVWDMYRDHWWTSPVMQEASRRLFSEYGRWLDSLNARNILYVSVMQEGSWNWDWYDPFTVLGSGAQTYPGTGALAQADADWAAWLSARGEPYKTFDESDPEVFGMWCGERFKDLLALRASAFREASRYRYAVGAEGAGGSNQYDRRLLGKHTYYYSIPELWAHVVDCLEIHSYRPVTGNDYWSGSTGFRTYKEWVADFRKPTNVGEVNYTYANASIDMSDTPAAWPKLLEKLALAQDLGYTGYAIWAWMDYDARKLGLLDQQYGRRPIADSLAVWIRGLTTGSGHAHLDDDGVPLFHVYPNPVPSGYPGALSLRFHSSGSLVRIQVFDLLGRSIATPVQSWFHRGVHQVRWQIWDVPSGMYFIRFESGTARMSKLMMKE